MDLCLVEDASALGLGEDKVEEEEEAEEGIEWYPDGSCVRIRYGSRFCCLPVENETGPGFKQQGDGKDNPVHEPWCK